MKATIIEWDKAFRSKKVKHPAALEAYEMQEPKFAAQIKELPLEIRQQKAEELANHLVEEALGLSLHSNPNERP
ncbi:hypothetical protein JH26_23945 [Microvirga sp. BSC39]|nr:hypothetical protein JH26_23945 [Microvirga sp. BSC39]